MKKIIAIFIMFITIGLVSLNFGTAGTSHEEHGKTDMSAPTAMESASPGRVPDCESGKHEHERSKRCHSSRNGKDDS